MSKIDEQIKKLQRKKQKIDLYERIIKNLDSEKKDPEGLMQEVSEEVKRFCKAMIGKIEESESESVAPKVATKPKAVEPVAEAKVAAPGEPKRIQVNPMDGVTMDPLRFVVTFKDWPGKIVKVKDGVGNLVPGKVVGASFPNLRIELDSTKEIVAVSPENIIEV